MVSRAVSVMKVDEALASYYSGITIPIEGVPTAVEVFVEEPSPEEVTERVYPSISINLIGIFEDTEQLDSELESSEEVGYDTGVIPYERHMRERPMPSRLVYSVTSWHKIRIRESRDLLYQALTKKTRPKSTLSVENIDGQDIDLWMFRSGGVSLDKEIDNDYAIYRSTVSVSIVADVSPVDFDDYVSAKVAMEINWDVYSRKILQGSDGAAAVITGGDEKDLRLTVTDTTEEGIP